MSYRWSNAPDGVILEGTDGCYMRLPELGDPHGETENTGWWIYTADPKGLGGWIRVHPDTDGKFLVRGEPYTERARTAHASVDPREEQRKLLDRVRNG